MTEEIQRKKTGTTTVGVVCSDGVVLAADKRATMGYMIAHKNVKKIHRLIDDIALTIAGGVGDAQMLLKYIKAEAKLYELKNQRSITVNSLGTLISHILAGGKNQFYPYYVQFLLAGKDSKGYGLYVLDPDGTQLADDFISTGSGSVFAYGVLQQHYKKGMAVEEGKSLVARAVSIAMERDIATGEGIDVVVIDKNGFRELSKEQINAYLNKK